MVSSDKNVPILLTIQIWDEYVSAYNVHIEALCAPPSALVHVCDVLWPGCSPYGSRDMENLSLSSFLYLCQALLFLLHPFPSLASVREPAMLSCSGVLSPPPLPPSLLPSCLLFLISHSLVFPYSFWRDVRLWIKLSRGPSVIALIRFHKYRLFFSFLFF